MQLEQKLRDVILHLRHRLLRRRFDVNLGEVGTVAKKKCWAAVSGT